LPHDVSVIGPTLAAHAIRAGLVYEYHLLVVPAMLGGGQRVLPSNVCVRLDLLDERRFTNGMVYLRYHTQA
jgi:dihydrofolate reductase